MPALKMISNSSLKKGSVAWDARVHSREYFAIDGLKILGKGYRAKRVDC